MSNGVTDSEITNGRQRIMDEESEQEESRLEKGFWFAIFSVAALVALIVIQIIAEIKPADIVAISGVLTGVLGVLVGLFGGSEVKSEEIRSLKKRAARNKMRFDMLLEICEEKARKDFYAQYGRGYMPQYKK